MLYGSVQFTLQALAMMTECRLRISLHIALLINREGGRRVSAVLHGRHAKALLYGLRVKTVRSAVSDQGRLTASGKASLWEAACESPVHHQKAHVFHNFP